MLVNEEPVDATKDPGSSHSSDNIFTQNSLSSPTAMPVIGTPEAQRKKLAVPSDSTEICEKTPEAPLKSPSSVLNPPSSLKRRTIRDYFTVASWLDYSCGDCRKIIVDYIFLSSKHTVDISLQMVSSPVLAFSFTFSESYLPKPKKKKKGILNWTYFSFFSIIICIGVLHIKKF